MNVFQTPLTYLKGVGPNRSKTLASELNIHTYQDLLHLFPNRYIDRTRFHKIAELEQSSAEVQIIGKITDLKKVPQKRGERLVATFVDETGSMELVWFRGIKWIAQQLKPNQEYVAFGRVNWFNSVYSMPHPDLELLVEYEKGFQISMQPIYPSTEKLTNAGITNKVVSKMVLELLTSHGNEIAETLSSEIIDQQKLMSLERALKQIHFPKNSKFLAAAQYRLKFEEFFFIQLQLLANKMKRKQKIKGYPFKIVGESFNSFYKEHLPFPLTNAQKRVVKEIRSDMGSNAQMNRLLQGDVGSGKTIVAVLSMLIAIDNGFQACLMAPTEILAEQHYNAIKELLKEIAVEVRFLSGSTSKADRNSLAVGLQDGSVHILIGTHALIEDTVVFKNLGLAVIDEQHRFGVKQRSKLWRKNQLPPHVLVMTATPIPRTLAMSVYGDLDSSVIDEMPPGRKEIKTVWRSDRNRLKIFAFLKEEIQKGRQIYIVYPLIQESAAMDYKDLMDGYESISRYFPLPDYQISIVHGKMKSEDKAYEMDRFVKGQTQIMVATTVIEVGVNVPNASVMIIESAERFGLSQLHQLRGRVGRGAEQSYCILISGEKLSSDAKTRLETMVRTTDGFEIAEEDLKLRGPGDLMGTQQSGVLKLKIADVVIDKELLLHTRQIASILLKKDPLLSDSNNTPIKNAYNQIVKHKNIWNYIS